MPEPKDVKPSQPSERERRLAEALRVNLRRRKAAAKAAGTADKEPPERT